MSFTLHWEDLENNVKKTLMLVTVLVVLLLTLTSTMGSAVKIQVDDGNVDNSIMPTIPAINCNSSIQEYTSFLNEKTQNFDITKLKQKLENGGTCPFYVILAVMLITGYIMVFESKLVPNQGLLAIIWFATILGMYGIIELISSVYGI